MFSLSNIEDNVFNKLGGEYSVCVIVDCVCFPFCFVNMCLVCFACVCDELEHFCGTLIIISS